MENASNSSSDKKLRRQLFSLTTDLSTDALAQLNNGFGMSAASISSLICAYCKNELPRDRTACPHCARPSLFPNVSLATSTEEKKKLRLAVNQAISDAEARGCRPQVEQFAGACEMAQAVFRCDLLRLHRQVASGTEIFAPYYDLERLRLRTVTASGFHYEKLRPQAEIELLGNEKHAGKLHYACLALDGRGLSSYGNCVVILSEPMIAHRATCFEGNTAIIYFHNRSFADALRVEWGDRHLICTAVMAGKIDATTSEKDFAGILAAEGASAEQASFVEVHVFGDMTTRTFSHVAFAIDVPTRQERVYMEAIRQKLNLAGVSVTGR